MKFLLLTLLLFSLSTYGGNIAITFGAFDSQDSKFQEKMNVQNEDFSKSLEKRGWKTSNHSGDNSSSEYLLKELQSLIKNKSFSKGDQLLLTFNGHGSKQKGDQEGHSVSLSDGEFDLDLLSPLIEELTQKGINVGFVDLSCFSGHSQKLFDDEVCKVTLSSESYYGWDPGEDKGFIFDFLQNLPDKKQKISLETHFLNARKDDLVLANFPQISSIVTPAKDYFNAIFYSRDPLGTRNEERLASSNYIPGLNILSKRESKLCFAQPELMSIALNNMIDDLGIFERAKVRTLKPKLISALEQYSEKVSLVDKQTEEIARNTACRRKHDLLSILRDSTKCGLTTKEIEKLGVSLKQNNSDISDLMSEIVKLERDLYDSVYRAEGKKILTRIKRQYQKKYGKNPCSKFKL